MIEILLLILSPIICSMGDPDWRVRESATKLIIKLRPLTLPAIEKALNNNDPEIRMRAELAINYPYISKKSFATYIAVVILYERSPPGQLPWVKEEYRTRYGKNIDVRKEILRIARAKGVAKPGERFSFEPEYDQPYAFPLAGVDDLRFRINNLPSPSEWLRQGKTIEELEKLVK